MSMLARNRAMREGKGFTLIELVVTVAIVAILARLAIPAYRDYVIRGQLVPATTLLLSTRAAMEQWYQDNRTYQAITVGTTTTQPPCNVSPAPSTGQFTLTCTAGSGLTANASLSATAYVLVVYGSGSLSQFAYSIDQTGAQQTIGMKAGWNAVTLPAACWLTKKGQTC